jgi:hypothetical protein
MHLLCIFVSWFVVWISLFSNFFLIGVFWISPLCLPVFTFGNTFAYALSHSDKDHEKISSLK